MRWRLSRLESSQTLTGSATKSVSRCMCRTAHNLLASKRPSEQETNSLYFCLSWRVCSLILCKPCTLSILKKSQSTFCTKSCLDWTIFTRGRSPTETSRPIMYWSTLKVKFESLTLATRKNYFKDSQRIMPSARHGGSLPRFALVKSTTPSATSGHMALFVLNSRWVILQTLVR